MKVDNENVIHLLEECIILIRESDMSIYDDRQEMELAKNEVLKILYKCIKRRDPK